MALQFGDMADRERDVSSVLEIQNKFARLRIVAGSHDGRWRILRSFAAHYGRFQFAAARIQNETPASP
jgi:hypothetical protein